LSYIYTKEATPDEWTSRLVDRVLREKRGDGHNPRDHRDVTLLGYMLGMLGRMMGGRMGTGIEGDRTRTIGFWGGGGTSGGGVFVDVEIGGTQETESAVVCCVDLDKAYDTVPRRW